MGKPLYCVIWCAAGCLPDGDEPAFVGGLAECHAWLNGPAAAEYFESVGDHNTYGFEVIEQTTESGLPR